MTFTPLRAGITLLTILALPAVCANAQIRVNPTGVSTNAMNATTVFLTFGGLQSQVAVESFWCGELLPAHPPDRGVRCDPATLYGRLPLRHNLSKLSGTGALTDVMSIPASIARRAYQDAERGMRGTFFYVRQFTSTANGASEFVAVTCRLTGGGANVPFALTNVTLAFSSNAPVEFVPSGAAPPATVARITYNGSGNLRGRWEVVMPGEERPANVDLQTEASLPPERRGLQKHYAELSRFNVLLPPGNAFELPGPDAARLPTGADGTYYLLLRIEATDDRAGDSNLSAAGAGSGIVHNGGVAGFPMPVLRYIVGTNTRGFESRGALRSVWPSESATIRADSVLVRWSTAVAASYSRVDFETEQGEVLLSAIVREGQMWYELPPIIAAKAGGSKVRWRVSTYNAKGARVERGPWNSFRIGAGVVGGH